MHCSRRVHIAKTQRSFRTRFFRSKTTTALSDVRPNVSDYTYRFKVLLYSAVLPARSVLCGGYSAKSKKIIFRRVCSLGRERTKVLSSYLVVASYLWISKVLFVIFTQNTFYFSLSRYCWRKMYITTVKRFLSCFFFQYIRRLAVIHSCNVILKAFYEFWIIKLLSAIYLRLIWFFFIISN